MSKMDNIENLRRRSLRNFGIILKSVLYFWYHSSSEEEQNCNIQNAIRHSTSESNSYTSRWIENPLFIFWHRTGFEVYLYMCIITHMYVTDALKRHHNKWPWNWKLIASAKFNVQKVRHIQFDVLFTCVGTTRANHYLFLNI